MKIKKILFSLMTVLFSGMGWYFFSRIFQAENLFMGNGINWLLFVIGLSLSYAFLFVLSLTRDRTDFALTTLLSSLWILVFMSVSAKTLLSALAIFVSSMVLIEFSSALARSLKIKYYFTAYSKIALVILVLIGVSSSFLQDRLTDSIAKNTFSEQTSNYAWPFIGKFVAEFNSEKSVDTYLREQFSEQGLQNPSNAMLAEQRKVISKQVGFEIQGREKMSEVGKKFVSLQLSEMLKTYKLDRTGVFVIFFSLIIVWPIGRFIFAIIATVLAAFLRRAGVLKTMETQITTKTLEL